MRIVRALSFKRASRNHKRRLTPPCDTTAIPLRNVISRVRTTMASKRHNGATRGDSTAQPNEFNRPLHEAATRSGRGERREQLGDRVGAFQRMPKGRAAFDFVVIPATHTLPKEHAGINKFAENALHCALGDSHRFGHVPNPSIRVSGHAEKHVGMIA